MKSNPQALIFTEDFDYSNTPKQSIWGSGDKETLRELQHMSSKGELSGTWLNFAAGDGRYNELLLDSADRVVATDIDPAALKKLRNITTQRLTPKLQTQAQDITKPFPFETETFNGVFNTGTLHLFPKHVLEHIFQESARVLKPKGLFVFDFATDIHRRQDNGTEIGKSQIQYSIDTAKATLSKLLADSGFISRFIFGIVDPEHVTTADGTYTFSCNFWLAIAKKK